MSKPNTPSAIQLICGIVFLISSLSLQGQNKWYTTADQAEAQTFINDAEATRLPDNHLAVQLDYDQLFELMSSAPMEFSGQSGLTIDWPMPDGSFESFEFFYSPTAEPGFLDEHPEIRSYRGISNTSPNTSIRLTFSILGLKGSIKSPEGIVYIDPVIEGKKDLHAIYAINEFGPEIASGKNFICGQSDDLSEELGKIDLDQVAGGNQLRGAGDPIGLRIFRTAIAATGEWTVREGGKANAEAKIMASIDRANLIFESEVGLRLVLVANNGDVVFEDPDTDPYPGTGRKDAPALINVNTTFVNRNIGVDNYDLGHVFTLGCNDNIGGLARRPCVCVDDQKAAATTCWSSTDLEYNVATIFCHEVGHQLSAPHTFNHCDRDNENLPTGYEPGSGSTIMSYAGVCGNQNVQTGSDEYFHSNSLMRIFGHSRDVTCGSTMSTNNSRPTVSFEQTSGFTIPISTPFYLSGEGADDEGDDLTFNIEQHDAAAGHCDIGQPTGQCPAFRSVVPSEDNYRVFPRFTTIWSNQTFNSKNEVLVDYTREFNFVMIVRDNNEEVGAFGMDTITFDCSAEAGPFVVDEITEAQVAGKHSLITWDVANTNAQPVNCQSVDILLYDSNDFESYTVIKEGTENDGNEWVIMPASASGLRVMVRAADNIFFDISNNSFDIEDASEAGYSFAVSPNSGHICVPNVFETTIESAAFGGFQGTLDVDVVSGLPAGATYAFGQSTLNASESTNLTIDLSNVTDNGNATVVVRAISMDADTQYQEINLSLTTSDFSAVAAIAPVDGDQGVSQTPTLSWSEADDADSYDVEVASNPSFDAQSLIQTFYNVNNASANVTEILEKSTIYFWRVRAKNICGEGAWSTPIAFSTEAAVCSVFEAPDKNVTVQKGQTTEFELNITADADIVDLNVTEIDFFCDFLQDAIISMVSPAGTEVVLADKACGNTTEMLCGFDDAASSNIKCPPNTGQSYRPKGNLSDFNGENALGIWKLKLEILRTAVASELGGWEIEICSNSALNAPYLVVNETMFTKPNENNPITENMLRTDDDNNTDDQLTYTLLTEPEEGQLELNGNPITAGMTFTQADLNSERLNYNNTGGVDAVDQFIFIVDDGEGGWTGSHVFDIDVNVMNPSSVSDLEFRSFFSLYPNPAGNYTTIVFDDAISNETSIVLTDLNGRALRSITLAAGTESHRIDLSDLSTGMYIIKGSDDSTFFSTKFQVVR